MYIQVTYMYAYTSQCQGYCVDGQGYNHMTHDTRPYMGKCEAVLLVQIQVHVHVHHSYMTLIGMHKLRG